MSRHSPSDHSPNIAEGRSVLGRFQLSPDLLHLNHGSYGAVPRDVAAEQDRWRALIERNPTGFFKDILPGELRRLAGLLALRFGGRADDWVFCENATYAVNSVLASFPLVPGDEILTTSHAYGAVLKAMRIWAERRGARLAVANIPAIVESEDEIVDAVRRAFTPRTRLLIVDHITSATAIVFPVARIAAAARAANIAVMIDGAHAPGQLLLNIEEIGADWYTGNAHKWLFAPKGCGMLWTAPSRQGETLPVVLSHGAPDGYVAGFDWVGTRDVTPWLCFEAAARAHDSFGGAGLMMRNRALASDMAMIATKTLSARVSAPDSMRAAMASLQLRPSVEQRRVTAFASMLQQCCNAVVPVHHFDGGVWVRISAQIYNERYQYEALFAAIPVAMQQSGIA